jgi:hypothetical protein
LRVLQDGGEQVVDVDSVDDYRAEVDDLAAAILDGKEPRVSLAFSRGNLVTLVALDRTARSSSASPD